MRFYGRKAAPILAVAAAALVVGMALPAAVSEASTLINGKSIVKRSIPGNRLEHNTVTGKQIKESTLGTVPKATLATTLPALIWHNATLENSWVDEANDVTLYGQPQWAVDAQGVVHLRGFVSDGSVPSAAFVLPPAGRPSHNVGIPVLNNNDSDSYLYIEPDGNVNVFNDSDNTNAANGILLNGVSFAR
jgi:hypothetical protein